MSAGFTPGPWGVQKPNSNDRRQVIALSKGGFDICNRVRSANDARLIAAAPALYEACALLDAYLYATAPNSNEARIVRDALALAAGTRSDETPTAAQSEGCQSGDAKAAQRSKDVQ